MRVVLDTNVLVRSHANAAGPARECFRRFEAGDHVLLVSHYLLTELARVLTYPRLMAIHRLSTAEIAEFLAAVQTVGELVDTPHDAVESVVSSDPDDDPIVQLAVNGRAEALCTLDRHLHQPAVRDYCRARHVRILTDVELLSIFRADEAAASRGQQS